MAKWLMAESGTGVGCVVDELEELEPLPPDPDVVDDEFVVALARTIVGVVDASVWVVDVTAEEVLVVASVLLVPVPLASALVGAEPSGEPDDGVRVACDPEDIAAVRPETLCACVEVPFEPWM
jgi:hypothetical protein